MLVLAFGVHLCFVVEVVRLHFNNAPRWPPEITPLTAQNFNTPADANNILEALVKEAMQ